MSFVITDVIKNEPTVPLRLITRGSCFIYDGICFMCIEATGGFSGKSRHISLAAGKIHHISNIREVEPVKIEATIIRGEHGASSLVD